MFTDVHSHAAHAHMYKCTLAYGVMQGQSVALKVVHSDSACRQEFDAMTLCCKHAESTATNSVCKPLTVLAPGDLGGKSLRFPRPEFTRLGSFRISYCAIRFSSLRIHDGAAALKDITRCHKQLQMQEHNGTRTAVSSVAVSNAERH